MPELTMSDEEWQVLSNAADVLERHGYHAESVRMFWISQHHR